MHALLIVGMVLGMVGFVGCVYSIGHLLNGYPAAAARYWLSGVLVVVGYVLFGVGASL